MARGAALGALVVFAAAIAAAQATPRQVAAGGPVPPAVRPLPQIALGFAIGRGSFHLSASDAPPGLQVVATLTQQGSSWTLVSTAAGADGRVDATAPLPDTVVRNAAATVRLCFSLPKQRSLELKCSESPIQVPPG